LDSVAETKNDTALTGAVHGGHEDFVKRRISCLMAAFKKGHVKIC
jgi:hypothetical protein